MEDFVEKPHILIVDDNPTNIEILVKTLQHDYTLGRAINGDEALEYAGRHCPGLILLDIMMPGMDGFEVCRQLKASPDTQAIGVIFITAVHDVESKKKGFEMGGLDYITKPFNVLEVKARVKTHMDLLNYRENLEALVEKRTHQLRESHKNIVRMQIQLLQRLGVAGEYKDNDTGQHVVRVGLYSGIIATAYGLDREFVNLIRMCSPLHDLGKIGVPDKILLKAGPLEDEEWDVMRLHSEIGRDILMPSPSDAYSLHPPGVDDGTGKNLDLLSIATNIVRCHHEKWDGTGYPDGLKGADIPIEARIVSLADVFDALASKRPYKEAFDEDTCIRMIRDLRGTHFDPDVVDAFFQSIDRILTVKYDLADSNPSVDGHPSVRDME